MFKSQSQKQNMHNGCPLSRQMIVYLFIIRRLTDPTVFPNLACLVVLWPTGPCDAFSSIPRAALLCTLMVDTTSAQSD